jgi:exoribonuclease II
MEKHVEVKLAKTYKSSLVNEKKLKDYLYERYFAQTKQNHKPKL